MVVAGVLLLSGCASVKIKDSAWIGSKGVQGGVEVHTLANVPEIDLTYIQFQDLWFDLSHPMVATSIETFADWKEDIESLCSKTSCSYDQKQAQTRLLRFIDRIELLRVLPAPLQEDPQ